MSKISSSTHRRGVLGALMATALAAGSVGVTAGPADARPTASFAGTTTVCALRPGDQGVYRYNGSGTSWTRIGPPAARLYGGGYGLFSASRVDGDIFQYGGRPDVWPRIGGPVADLAVTDTAVFKIPSDRQSVNRYSGSGLDWPSVGGPAAQLYGGGFGLFATTTTLGDIFRFDGPNAWTKVGERGAEFAVSDSALIGLTVDRQNIFAYNGSGWRNLSGPTFPTSHLHAGRYGLFSISASTDEILRYVGSTIPWIAVGNPGIGFTVTDSALFGITLDGQNVIRYSGTGAAWTKVGGPATQIVSCP